jgi:hypothetical protein
MNYTFINIEKNEIYSCSKELWLEAIKTAQNNGWEPSGTIYNRLIALNDAYDDDDEESFRLFMYIVVNNAFLTWDGNYTDRADQIVSEIDANNLYESLIYAKIDDSLFDFIGKGSFIIVSM